MWLADTEHQKQSGRGTVDQNRLWAKRKGKERISAFIIHGLFCGREGLLCTDFFILSLFLLWLINDRGTIRNKRHRGTWGTWGCVGRARVRSRFVALGPRFRHSPPLRRLGLVPALLMSGAETYQLPLVLAQWFFSEDKEFEMHRQCNYCFHQTSKNKAG